MTVIRRSSPLDFSFDIDKSFRVPGPSLAWIRFHIDSPMNYNGK